ncbi:MAG TPA: YciI family protein [Micromonosporaceae bacterium]
MEFFVYCRDRADSGELREALAEAHWSYMDTYASAMIGRGPTLTQDGSAATGSLHIVDLPDRTAADRFAYEEPNYQAGIYRDVLIRRWHNALGRTMWDYADAVPGYRRFLLIGHARDGAAGAPHALRDAWRAYLAAPSHQDRLILAGPLWSDTGAEWLGTSALVELPDAGAAEALLREDPYGQADLYGRVEVHYWRFGGREAS